MELSKSLIYKSIEVSLLKEFVDRIIDYRKRAGREKSRVRNERARDKLRIAAKEKDPEAARKLKEYRKSGRERASKSREKFKKERAAMLHKTLTASAKEEDPEVIRKNRVIRKSGRQRATKRRRMEKSSQKKDV